MQFSKMHGLGNDFMVVDAVTQNVFFSPELIRRLADRHLGVGFDQLLVVEPPYDDAGFNIYILDETNRAEVYHHCEGSKEELVRDVSRFYSSSHDRFTYGSSFINFNLPQFYQIVKVDGRAQVIPFRTQVIAAAPANQDANAPLLQQYFS